MEPSAQDLRELVRCFSGLAPEERARILALVRSLDLAQSLLPPLQAPVQRTVRAN